MSSVVLVSIVGLILIVCFVAYSATTTERAMDIDDEETAATGKPDALQETPDPHLSAEEEKEDEESYAR